MQFKVLFRVDIKFNLNGYISVYISTKQQMDRNGEAGLEIQDQDCTNAFLGKLGYRPPPKTLNGFCFVFQMSKVFWAGSKIQDCTGRSWAFLILVLGSPLIYFNVFPQTFHFSGCGLDPRFFVQTWILALGSSPTTLQYVQTL